jgi:hypothetical protein
MAALTFARSAEFGVFGADKIYPGTVSSDVVIDTATFLTEEGLSQDQEPFCGTWDERHPWNVPGPFYCGDDDCCGTGPLVAPNNVILGNAMLGDRGGEFIFRQPVNRFELDQIVKAAQINVTNAYGCDGNQRWTAPLVRQWWKQRTAIEHMVKAECDRQLRLGAEKDYLLFAALGRYHHFLEAGAASYLQQYIYFLKEGRYPNEGTPLPDLS